MSFGDNPGRNENLQGEGRQQALQAMIWGSADAYASMFNAALLPFLLYQKSLRMANQVTLGNLRAATGAAQPGTPGSSRATRRSVEAVEGATRSDTQTARLSIASDLDTDRTALQQGSEVGHKTAQQDMEAINQAARDKMRTAGQSTLQQNVEATSETARESYAEAAEGIPPTEVDELVSGSSDPVPAPSLEATNAVGELLPSPAPEASAGPTAKVTAVGKTDEARTETSGQAERAASDEATSPSAAVPSTPQEEAVTAEEPPLTQEESPADEGTNTMEELPPPPEVPDVELPPPPPVSQNTLDELPQPPTAEVSDESTAQEVRREAPRLHVKKITVAARRKAEEMNIDLTEVEGTGRDGQITVGDVRKKAGEQPS